MWVTHDPTRALSSAVTDGAALRQLAYATRTGFDGIVTWAGSPCQAEPGPRAGLLLPNIVVLTVTEVRGCSGENCLPSCIVLPTNLLLWRWDLLAFTEYADKPPRHSELLSFQLLTCQCARN